MDPTVNDYQRSGRNTIATATLTPIPAMDYVNQREFASIFWLAGAPIQLDCPLERPVRSCVG